METRKYYVVRRTRYITNGNETVAIPEYARGYGRWDQKFDKAHQYPSFDSVKRLLKKMTLQDKPEILYITMTIETASDLMEKEFFGDGDVTKTDSTN